ncbi:hypothetical protein RYX56_11990 [Alkalihalophilus lindianensis]|uniref:Uncharacterized protein n=1 Tax=Alkalihalophilus lindianensis TaxID=1630542 RepID=A0ABU3XB76_9BACI|nr:hypothetical protein [Alkalihalophilus lindianensis]MDV2685093.1 hypothetical protein [Alkalihalophilus lindianensis]
MNKQQQLSKLTPIQLQQRLIYTQSELNKYKKEVDKYQNNYHYSLIDELQEKNKLLHSEMQAIKETHINEKQAIVQELMSVKQQFLELEKKHATTLDAFKEEKIQWLEEADKLKKMNIVEESSEESVPKPAENDSVETNEQEEAGTPHWFNEIIKQHKKD